MITNSSEDFVKCLHSSPFPPETRSMDGSGIQVVMELILGRRVGDGRVLEVGSTLAFEVCVENATWREISNDGCRP